MDGQLFIYNAEKKLCAFQTGKKTNPDFIVVLIGGLTDGFLTLPFVKPVSDYVESNCNGCLVQILMTSSYQGFGNSSLKQDAEEIDSLLEYLQKKHSNNPRIILIGHSTGCQDVLTYLNQQYSSQKCVIGCILQGGVSDREYFCSVKPEISEFLTKAAAIIKEGRIFEILPREADLIPNVPITAYRYNSLLSKEGDDDYFSSDLPSNIQSKIFDVQVPLVVVLSGADEYVPPHISIESLARRYEQYPSVKLSTVIDRADHSISSEASIESFLGILHKSIDIFEKNKMDQS